MRVLGRGLVEPFSAFWEAYEAEVGVDTEHLERGLSTVFGDQGAELAAPNPPRWMSLPDDDLAYHVAHELAHRVLVARGYPKTVRGAGYPPDSAEARVGEDLEEMVLHPSLHALLEPFGFSRDFILRNMAQGALNGVSNAPIPEYGSPWHFTWAIRYCLLQMELPLALWKPLEIAYRERAAAAASLGRELVDIMVRTGWGSREQAMEAMVQTRDVLGLDIQDKVLVLDPVSHSIV